MGSTFSFIFSSTKECLISRYRTYLLIPRSRFSLLRNVVIYPTTGTQLRYTFQVFLKSNCLPFFPCSPPIRCLSIMVTERFECTQRNNLGRTKTRAGHAKVKEISTLPPTPPRRCHVVA